MVTNAGGKIMTTNQKIRLIQFVNLLASIVAIGYVIYTKSYLLLLLSYSIFVVLFIVGIGACLHRLLSHKSYTTHPVIAKIITLISVYCTVGSPVAWVAIHRTHHGFTDKENDPHSPYHAGELTVKSVWRSWTGYGGQISKVSASYVKDLMRDNFNKILHQHYFKILLIPVIFLFAIDPILAIFVYCLPATLTLNATSIVNVLGHSHGYRNHETDDCSTNSWIANIITLGEGWHNNHHKYPANFSTKEKSHEWDFVGNFINLIRQK
jgi:fatty-acid desaturase